MVELLGAPDIRDKPKRDQEGKETDEIEKLGIFDRHGVIKADHEPHLTDLIQRIQTFFDERTHPGNAA